MHYKIEFEGRDFYPTGTAGWKTTSEGMAKLKAAGRLAVQGNSLAYIRYIDDFPVMPLNNIWNDTQSGSGMDKRYVVQTNAAVIQCCILMTTDPGDLVLDPTCGSGTTAYVAEQWGRCWITTDTSRIALNIRDEIKSRDVQDIAYWMLDDRYDGSNFVARQVFFCGGDKEEFNDWKRGLSKRAEAAAKKKVEQTLKLGIDEEAFGGIYGHLSRPFAVKAGQKIAIRVVSQFGEETTKVLAV